MKDELIRRPPSQRIGQPCHRVIFFLWVIAWLTLSPTHADSVTTPGYQLGPGDGILIKVDDEPDMTLDTRISAQGTIHFVLLGEIPVAGMTVTELQKDLEARLADGYLRKPRVNITIKEYRIVFVQGEVKNPGGFPFQPGLTVRKIIVLAGGFTDVANKDRVTIIRGTDKNFQEQPIALDEPVLPGDVVTVQESFW